MRLETARQPIRSSPGQAPKIRDAWETDDHFHVRFHKQAIWFLQGKIIQAPDRGCPDWYHPIGL